MVFTTRQDKMVPSFFALWVIALSGAAALLSNDPTSSASYPLCAVSCLSSPSFLHNGTSNCIMRSKKLTTNINQQICQNASIPSSGCGSLSNRACVCKSPTLKAVNTCEVNTCSASDYKSMVTSPFCLHRLEQTPPTLEVLNLCPVSHWGSRGSPMQPGRRYPEQCLECIV